MNYAADGKCHNSQPGTYGHECGKPAQWVGTTASGFKSGFCAECKESGYEARPVVAWERYKAPNTHTVWGKVFNIVAEFPDTDEGTKQANAFMEQNRDTGLLAAEGGRLILAALSDKGRAPAAR